MLIVVDQIGYFGKSLFFFPVYFLRCAASLCIHVPHFLYKVCLIFWTRTHQQLWLLPVSRNSFLFLFTFIHDYSCPFTLLMNCAAWDFGCSLKSCNSAFSISSRQKFCSINSKIMDLQCHLIRWYFHLFHLVLNLLGYCCFIWILFTLVFISQFWDVICNKHFVCDFVRQHC